MGKRNSTVYTILRSIKQPTKLDEVINSVPKPKGAVPNFGLPKWKSIPLESKIPFIPGPEDAYHFSRNKVGKKLYTSSKNAEFDLTDPNHYDIEIEYDSLHDRHLARYFSNEKNLLRLKKLGFITEELDAKCSVKEYNMYRKYLQKLHGDRVKRELRRRGEMRDEERVLRVANVEAQKELAKLKSDEKKIAARNRIKNSQEFQAAEKRRQQLLNMKKAEERLKKLELQKKEQKDRMILRAKIRAEHLKRRRKRATERERQKMIKLLLKCRKKDRERQKRVEECTREAEKAKREALEKKWMERERYQELLLTIEKFVFAYADGETKRNIDEYMKKVERERMRLKRKIENTSKFLTCYNVRHSSRPKRSCCVIESKPKTLEERVKSFESSNNGVDSYTDECEMTEQCKCDISSEYCMDLRQLPV